MNSDDKERAEREDYLKDKQAESLSGNYHYFSNQRIHLLNRLEEYFSGVTWEVKDYYYTQGQWPPMNEFWISAKIRDFDFRIKVNARRPIGEIIEIVEQRIMQSFLNELKRGPRND
jgi:hypothetical protein